MTPTSGRAPGTLSPLRDDLDPDIRAFVEDLRQVFSQLGLGVRRYATRRFLTASALSRYLSGTRIPPWVFVADLITDVEEKRGPLTPGAEAALRELHRRASERDRGGREAQVLEARLAEADEETRRITTRQRALEEALLKRERRLTEVQARCHRLELRLEGEALARRGEVETWRGEHARLEEERAALQEAVVHLREALAVAQAELAAAEDRCHRLEHQLDELAAAPDGGEMAWLTAMLEADRRPVPELVRAVGDLEQRTRAATAMDLVRSAGQSRSVEEVAGLLAALRREGWDSHARTALAAIAVARPVGDLSALARELLREDMEEYLVVLLQASAANHQPGELAEYANSLGQAGMGEYAHSLLGAAAVVRPVEDVLAVIDAVPSGAGRAEAALRAAAKRRPVPDLADLALALRRARMSRECDALCREAAAVRPVGDVVGLIYLLENTGLVDSAQTLLSVAQSRTADYLIGLVQALPSDHAWTVLYRASLVRPIPEIAVLTGGLYVTGRPQLASVLLGYAVQGRTTEQTAQMLDALDQMQPGWDTLAREIGRRLAPDEAADLVAGLEAGGMARQADALFRAVVDGDLAGHVARFLAALDAAGCTRGHRDMLHRYTSSAGVRAQANLLLALETAGLTEHRDALIRSRYAVCPVGETGELMTRLTAAGGEHATGLVEHVIDHMVTARSIADLVSLFSLLSSAELTVVAHTLGDRAWAVHGKHFRDQMKRARAKQEPIRSRATWVLDDTPPGPIALWIQRTKTEPER
ncbi:ATP/GTP-binding protein [Streptomyces sp. NPDC005953]|uniref:ATP/GTP-binding protein n=1 Tax=Streptomyces sp. NPDC005953 TaxID=3156719 RepID=UPI00340E9DB8